VSTSSGADAVGTIPELVCPLGTERDVATSASGSEAFCVRVVAPSPGVDISGSARIRTGPSVARFAGGKVSAAGDWEQGVRVGVWRYFHADGTPFAEGSYTRGRRTGAWVERRSHGKLRVEATYVDDRLDGPWRNVWGGVVVGEGSFEAGETSGTWTSHFCGGGVHQTLTLARGKLDGPCARFGPGGVKMLEGEYRGGKKSGAWREYLSNGSRFESAWVYDAREGPFRWLAADGHVAMEGSLRAGKLDGRWLTRDAAGHVLKEGVYEQGTLARGDDVTTVPRLNGYENNAYCASNLQGLWPQPSAGGPFAGSDEDLTKVVCDRF
jgi:antitoxin component YwqK of YwqJK toxin-antitoxin module